MASGVVEVPQSATSEADATSIIQASIDACANASGYNSGVVMVPPGTYYVENLLLRNRVNIVGAGKAATFLKLRAGATGDVITDATFSTLTGSNSQSGIGKWSLSHLTLDGNKSNCPSGGWCLRQFGQHWRITDVEVRYGKAGGLFTEWGTGGIDMESRMSDVHIRETDGPGWHYKGPHDTQVSNVIIWGCVRGLVCEGNGGGLFGTNVHVWGNTTQPYGFEIYTGGNYFVNAYADGSGILLEDDGNHWEGWIVNPSESTGLTAISLGPSVAARNSRVKAHIEKFRYALVCGTENNNVIELVVDGPGTSPSSGETWGTITGGPSNTDYARIMFSGQDSVDGEQLKVPGFIHLKELTTDPAAPATNEARLYVRDNGGKTELVVRFPTGAIQVLSTEP